jgi:hypothetical protein
MSLLIENNRNFLGFGDGERKGEYLYSQGMKRSRNGIKPYWVMATGTDSSTVASLGLFKWFDQRVVGSDSSLYAINSNGSIFTAVLGTNTWVSQHDSSQTTKGNGIIVDHSTSTRVLYAQSRYLGMWDGTWHDTWQDFGAEMSPNTADRPMDLYEDWVAIGNQNKIALLNITDDSFNSAGLTLPAGFLVKAVKSGKNGLLIGANFGNRSALILWDCATSGSIAPWIWNEGLITSITKYGNQWIVMAGNEIFVTNGYSKEYLTTLPDVLTPEPNSATQIPTYPSGMFVKNFYLFILSDLFLYNRRKAGVWIFDLRTNLWEFCPVTSGAVKDISFGGMFLDSSSTFHIAYKIDPPVGTDKYYLGKLQNAISSKSFFISSPIGKGDNKKVAEGIILNLAWDTWNTTSNTPDLSVTVGIYDYKRQLFNYAVTNATSTISTRLRVNGTVTGYNNAEVGDLVMILHGDNSGEIAFISSIINQDLATEGWNLDRSLTNLTENVVYFSVMPIKKVASDWSITTLKIGDKYFPVNSIEGRKFSVFAYITGSYLTPELHSISLLYNNLGYL